MRNKTKKQSQEERNWKKMITRVRNIEFLGGFFYDAYGGEMLSIFVYDKKKKKVLAGTLDLSSYSKKEILSREYAIKKNKKNGKT